jgi:hypothetical protein
MRKKRRYTLNAEPGAFHISFNDAALTFMRERREILTKRPWLRWTLLVFDVAAVLLGLLLGPIVGLLLGLIAIAIGELVGPTVIERVTRDRVEH